MIEQWRDVSGYEGQYQVSDRGQVRNFQTGTILQPIKMRNGRLYVSLSSEGFQRKALGTCVVSRNQIGITTGASEEIARCRPMK